MEKVSTTAKNDGKYKVLIVEDNEMNREMLAFILEEEGGFEVYEAENGLVGLQQLEDHYEDISVILLDIMMPICDGHEFLRRKMDDERFMAIPVIVTTASCTTDDEIACLELGANDFVAKPYNVAIMNNRINNIIRLRESASLVNLMTWDTVVEDLYSERFFYRHVESVFNAHPDTDYDIVCSDIGNFKSLNDRYGRSFCDQMLRDLSERLQSMLPGLVAAGRIGGDVFAFLMEHQERGWEDALYHIGEGTPYPNVSVKFGIVEHVRRNIEISTICDRALIALERIKGPLGIGVSWYDEALHDEQVMEQHIIHNMRAALEERQFTVQFQPKHNMKANVTGGAEALVRWIHPELGFINPGQFIYVFERNGFITQLDLYVWEEACRQIKRCEELGLPSVPISVNVSRLDFDVPDLAEQLAAVADKYGVDHSLLHVELTETAYTDNPDAVATALARLQDVGFLIELDDFGSGYSSLATLNTLPLDVIKLDMSIVRQAEKFNDYRIVQSTIELAKILDLKIVVEGVETAEVAERLRDLGCDYIQGYYYSRPLKREEFEEYLSR